MKKRLKFPMRGAVHGTFATQAIQSPDRRAPKTGVVLPDNIQIEEARQFVMVNEK